MNMESYRNTAIIVGVLFITATVTSILSTIFLGSTLNNANYLTSVFANSSQVIIGFILELIAALSAFGTAIMLYPVLKKHIESLALGYVGFRLIENLLYIIGAIILLIILTLSQQYTAGALNAAGIQTLGSLLLALHDWFITIGTVIIFGLGSLTLNYILYQSKLVPRIISIWGLIGAALVLIYGLITVAILNPNPISSILTILALPIAVQEIVFALWLIIKGFNQSALKPNSTDINKEK